MNRISKVKTLVLASAAAAFLATSTPVMAEEKITVVYNAPKKSALAKAAKKFIKEANKMLAGTAKLKRAKRVANKKGKKKKVKNDKKVAKAVKKSRADIAIVSIDMAKAIRKPLGIFEMPWLVTNSVQAEAILDKKKGIGKKIKRSASRSKFVLVGVMNRGFQYLATYQKPFTKPSDLKGLWIGTGNSGYVRKALKAYGAKYGVLDGTITSLKIIAKKPKKYMTAQAPKYVSNVPMTYTPALILFGKKNKKMRKLFMTSYKKKGKTKWKFNANGKKLAKAAKKAAKLSWNLATKNDQKAWEKIMKNKKIKVMKIDLNAFRKASKKIYKHYETRVNGAYGTLHQVRKITGTMAGS